jgi:radical SAM superfamily enzyme YgiQ (UPF0313 family)
MMNITLVKPPEHSLLNFGTFSLAVLAAAVRDIADITIVDATYYEMDKAAEKIVETNPDLVGITTMGTTSCIPATSLIQVLRSCYTNPIVVGGHGAAIRPLPYLKAGADAVVCGEGEITFREILLKGISDSVRGLALVRDGKLVKTPSQVLIEPLDLLREPARDLAGPPPDGIGLVETSRGCPYGCAFCEATRFYYQKWRPRSAEVVCSDIQNLVKKGAEVIHIVDDNFTADPKRALHICELLEKKMKPLFFLFSGRCDDLLKIPELIPALARAHFLRAGIGIETLEPELAHFIGKPISFEQHRHACTEMREAGIFTMASFIVGLPGETEDMRTQSVESAVRVGADSAQWVPFQPLPGTPLEKGDGSPEPWCVEAAAKTTYEFRRHPVVIARLVEAAHQPTVRGMLARASLVNRLKGNLLDPDDADRLLRELDRVDPGLAGELGEGD